MSQIWGIPLVVLIILNWILYHKIFHVAYFGSLARGLFNEFIWCTLAAMLELAIIIYLGGSVLGFVGTIFGVIFRIIIILAAIIAVGCVIYKLYNFFKKDKSNISEKMTTKVGEVFSKFNNEKKTDIKINENDKICCPVCGGLISAEDKFCINCGTKIVLDMEESSKQSEGEIGNTIICPVCGSSVNAGDKFCTTCGRKI